jgi:hypothetical protein
VNTSVETGTRPTGHALMATCPPFAEEKPDASFGHIDSEADSNPGQPVWKLSKGDLARLLHLSKELELEGEITPVMAWGMILAHPRFIELTVDDFASLAEELKGRIRCYG